MVVGTNTWREAAILAGDAAGLRDRIGGGHFTCNWLEGSRADRGNGYERRRRRQQPIV